ncbi:MAG: flagellar motor protein MotB [Aquaspirillum sp.]
MADESQRPIIIKRIKKGGHAHHGGAWKIAYADFVTAMMAFFLLMWLLSSVSQGALAGISEYFRTPLKVALLGGDGAGDATSPIKGGGEDLTRSAGQVNRSNIVTDERKERVLLNKLSQKITQAIESNQTLKQFKDQITLEMTPEGLRVQIIDEKNRPMFDSGSASLLPHTRLLLQEMAKILNDVPNRLSISGHTDATPFAAGERGYSNWELSADRANAARRELLLGGMTEQKMLRVTGLAAANPLDQTNPTNPINRRITIIVLNKKTEEEILRESGPSVADRAAAAAPSPAPAETTETAGQ